MTPTATCSAAFALVALFNEPGRAAPIAYLAGSLCTLIGADLLNLPLVLRGGLLAAGPQRLWVRGGQPEKIPANQPRVLSIGGAGLFDGIFLTGIIAPFLVGTR